jgi:O-antigen/teichoic acid export membrane protein
MSESSVPMAAAKVAERVGKLAIRGSFYEIVSFGTANALRLASNLVLTRLLFPEAFGQAAILAIVNQGLVMLSDVGITPGVVQSPRGDDPEFLDTAWTMHVVRGVVLTLTAMLASYPIAWLYDDLRLVPLLAVGSLGVLFAGFESTSMMTLLRRVQSRRIMVVDLGSQLVGIAVTVLAAWYFRSVWALVAGSVTVAATRTLLSHLYAKVEHTNRLRWSKEAAQVIVRFGKWIFFSSAVGFVAQQVDRIFLGKFFGLSELGIYTVAVTLADLGTTVVTRLTHQILFPSFSRVFRETPERLKSAYYRARGALDLATLPAAGLLFALGPWVIGLMYDSRYQEAGWMLRVLTVRVAFTCIVVPCETCLFSMGRSHFGFVKSVCRLGWMMTVLPVAYHYFGIRGLVWTTALSELPALMALLPAFWQRSLLSMRRELLVPVYFGAGAGAGFLMLALR